MAANDTLGLNQSFQIYHENGSAYEGLVMHKAATDSVVMSLGDSISGDVYWHDNELQLTLKEYITYNGVNYVLVNPPTIVREGMVSDNSELKGMTKYSFKFYHPMYQLGNIPFSDVAVTNDQKKYLSENKVFSWIGTANDFLAKLNKNLDGTQWMVEMSSNFPNDKKTEMSDVLAFDKNSVADALKTAYDTWGVPYVIDVVTSSEASYNSGKRFKVVLGLPSNEIYENATKKQQNLPYIFKMGKGVGLKNNSRTPRNNKIITRIAGYGSETNIPYGYPQIVWTGNQSWDYTIQNNPNLANSYPIYDGIVGGQKVRLIKHPFTRTHLMPTVYVNAVNKKVNPNASGYRADTVLVDYYDATAADHYPNPINLQAPSYDIHEFEDIKPELGSVAITGVTPLNPDLTPASSWDDTMDDDGNFVQSHFMVTLPVLSFDIYACAAITESMEINMRSGDCLGCTFPVEVDWEDYKANFYNEDGEFDPVIHSVEGDGHVRNGRKYPNSASTSVTLILKKENTTFGVLMPNTYQHPAAGDTFVVLGISLPTSYITSAQTRLDNAMKSFMLENNVHYYDYPLKFDEAFLRNNTYILEQLKPNAIVRFEFAGNTMPLYVKQMNVKFGEGVLPKYDITLTDNVEVVLNQIGQVADDVEKLSSLLSLLRQSYDSNVWVALAKKLSKTDDDTAQGFIRFVKGLQVGERFDSGLLGEGGVFRKDADGTTYIEADKLYIRMKAYFDTVEIRRFMHSGGNRIASPAGAKCVRVENMAWYAAEGKFVPVDENGTYRKKDINDEEYVVATGLDIVRYRCYFRGEDNDGDKVTNDFLIGDQAYCKITNGDTASLMMHNYWRLVVGTNVANDSGRLTEDGEFWIDLANYHDAYGQPVNVQWVNSRGVTVVHKSHQAGSDIPRAQDDIVQLGSADDTTRQGAIIEHSSGEDAPSYKIYQGIDDFSFKDTNYISLGYDSETGRAYMNVYGDAYIGDRNENTYIKYVQEDEETGYPRLKIKAEVEFIHSDGQGGTESTTMDDFIDAIQHSLEDIQDQIDGSIDTWYYEGVPTLNNQPAVNWTTPELKHEHIGDLYYDKANADAYRFILDTSVTPNEYKWIRLHDDAITEALRLAAEAKDTADNKRRVFLTQPVPPYDQGDLWVNATYPANYTGETDESQHKYNNEILKCIVAVPVEDPETGDVTRNSFLISDWSLSNGYTSRFNDFLYNTYAPFISNIQGQVDQKAETWYQDSNPATAWYDATQAPVYDVRAQHVGDIWMDTSANGGKQTYIYQYNTSTANYEWKPQAVPNEVFDYADGKCAVYFNNPTNTQNPYPTNYHEKDMWVLPIDGTHDTYTIGGVEFKAGEVLFSSSDSTSFVAAHWSKKLRYTGDERIDGFINQILNGTGASGNDATVANAISSVTGAIKEDNTVIDGGLVLTSLIGLRSNSRVWAGISGMYKNAETGTGYKGHGIAAWYGGGMQDWEVYLETLTPTQQQSATITDAYAKSLFRFDGSGYLASGNITWTKDGQVTISDLYTMISGESDFQTDVLNKATLFSNLFHTSTTGTEVGTLTRILPQAAFKYIDIDHDSNYTLTNSSVLNYGEMKARFVPLEFFNALFTAYSDANHTNAINPWTWTDTAAASRAAINNLKILVGTWTEQYLSAYGLNPSGGSGGGSSTLAGLTDTAISSPSSGQVLVYDGLSNKWVNGAAQSGGGIISISMSVPTGFSVSPSTISNNGGTFAITFGGTVTKNQVLASPATANGTPLWRTLVSDDIPDLSDTYASTSDVTTLQSDVEDIQGYFTNGVANVADKLNTGNTTYTAWGRTFWTNGKPKSVSGEIKNASHIRINNNAKIYWKTSPLSETLSEQYISILTLDSDNNFVVGESMANSGLSTYIRGRRVVLQTGTGNSGNHRATLDADGVLTVEKLVIGSITIEHDTTNGGLHIINAGVYADTYFSAYGIGSGGGGGSISLNQPLSGINSAGLGAPSAAGSAIVWNGSSWTYSSNSNLRVASLSSLGSITVYSNVTSQYGGFAVSGKNDNYILTAGGGTKLFKLAIDSTSLEDGQALVYDESTSSWVNGSTISGNYWTKTEITELKNYTSVQSFGWVNVTDDAKKVVTSNALCFWNGCYKTNKSNLAYCVRGEFGNIVTKNITDFMGLRNINGTYGSSTDPLNNLTGSFAFYGNYLIGGQYDWVGLQVSNDGADRGQIVWSDGTLWVRQQEDWSTWTSWATVLTSNNYSSYVLPKTGGQLSGALTITSGGLTLANGNVSVAGNVTANKFTLNGGTSSQFLKADGSVDSNVYIQHKEVGQDSLVGYSGSFFFGGSGTLASGEDYVGFQAGNNSDRWQMAYLQGNIKWRENAAAGSPTTGWTEWRTVVDSNNISSYLSGYDTKNTAGSTAYTGTGDRLYIIGADSMTTYRQTYANVNCYIKDNCLYSNGAKVLTSEQYQGTVTSVKVGTTSYSPSSGVVSLPAYPTNTDTLNTAGGDQNSSLLYLVGMPSQTTGNGSARTYTKSACYIDTDNCLYSNNSKVLTESNSTFKTLTVYDSAARFTYNSGDATLKLYPISSTYGAETVGVQTNIDGIDPETATGTYNPSGTIQSRCVLALQPRGGYVGIGTTTPYKRLHVLGGVRAERPNSDSEGGGFQSVYGSKIASFGCNTSGGLVLANGTVDSNGDPTFTTCAIFSASDVTDPYMSVKPNTRIYQTSGSSSLYLGRSDNAGWVCLQNCASAASTSNWALRTNGDARFLWVGINGNNTSYRLYVNGTSYLGGNTLALGSISPVNNISYHLGSSSTRWSTVYCASVNASSDCSISGNVTISGVLGVGGSNGSFKLYVSGSAKVSTYLGVATDPDTSDSTNKLFVGGAVKASAYNYMSDVRKKNIIDYIDKDIAEIANAPIFDYTWKDSEDRSLHVGSSAQYWLNVLPHVVSQSSDGFYFMDYSCTALASVIITARKVQNHEERILELERENEALRKEIETLKAA